MKYEAMMFENVVNIFAAITGLVHTHLHTLCVDTFIPEGDVALGDDLTADSAPTIKYFYPAHVKIFPLTWWCCSTRRSKLRSPSRRTSPPVASCRTCTWQQTDAGLSTGNSRPRSLSSLKRSVFSWKTRRHYLKHDLW